MNIFNVELISFLLLFNEKIVDFDRKNKISLLFNKIIGSEKFTDDLLNKIVAEIDYNTSNVGIEGEDKKRLFNHMIFEFWKLCKDFITDKEPLNPNIYFEKYINVLKIIKRFISDEVTVSKFLTDFCNYHLLVLNILNLPENVLKELILFIDNLQTKSCYFGFSFDVINRIRESIEVSKYESLSIFKDQNGLDYIKKIMLDSIFDKLRFFDLENLKITEIKDFYSYYDIFPSQKDIYEKFVISSKDVYDVARYNHKVPPEYGFMILKYYNIDPIEYLHRIYASSVFENKVNTKGLLFGDAYPFDLEKYLFFKTIKAYENKYDNDFSFIEGEFSEYAKKYSMDIHEIISAYAKKVEQRKNKERNISI